MLSSGSRSRTTAETSSTELKMRAQTLPSSSMARWGRNAQDLHSTSAQECDLAPVLPNALLLILQSAERSRTSLGRIAPVTGRNKKLDSMEGRNGQE